MATKITGATLGDCITGSAETRIDVAPDGTLWTAVVDPQVLRWFSSKDGGTTWVYSSGSDLTLGQYNGAPSIFIDADGYCHVAIQRYSLNPQDLLYARGRPKTGGGWSWTTLAIRPAAGRMGVDTDVKAFRVGNGWVAFCLWNAGSGAPAPGTRVARVDISPNHALSLGAVDTGVNSGHINSYGALAFATQDGKSPDTAPHLFLATGAQAISSQPLRFRRATYESGRWEWGTPVTVASAVNLLQTVLVAGHDGTRFVAAWAVGNTPYFAEWTGSGSAVLRQPPALPSGTGNILGASLSIESSTDDLYLMLYGADNPDVIACKFTRSGNAWGTWTQVADRTGTYQIDGKVSALRHIAGTVPFVYVDSFTSSRFEIRSAQIVGSTTEPETPTPVSPSAPALLQPGAGASIDLAAGARFTWRHAAVTAGDRQQAWQLRRVTSNVTWYWAQAGQAWQTTEIWNAGERGEAIFPIASWAPGTHAWAVRTRSAIGGATSPWSGNRTVIVTSAPAVVVTSPSGLYYEDSQPIVEWTYTSVLPQRAYEVRVVETPKDVTTTPIWSTGGIVSHAGARKQRVDTALRSGVGYRAYVRAIDQQGTSSAWAWTDFVVSLVPPAGPRVEVSDEISYDTGVPRARLDLVAQSNFMTSDQAKCIGGWEQASGSVSQTTVAADPLAGIEEGRRLAAGNSAPFAIRTNLGSPPAAPYGQAALTGPLNFPVEGQRPYTFLVHVRSDAKVRGVRASLRWFRNDDGTSAITNNRVSVTVTDTVGTSTPALISDSVGPQVVTDTDTYVQVAITAIAPFGAKMARPYLEFLGTGSTGEVHWITRASFHPGYALTHQPGGYSDQQTVRVLRSDDGGTTWVTAGERIKTDFRQLAVFYDRSVPFGKEVRYAAFTDVDATLGGVVSSAVSDTSVLTVPSATWAIRDLSDELAELPALVIEHSRADEEVSKVYRPAGRFYPIIDSEGPQSAEGSVRMYVPRKDVAAMIDLLTTGTTMLLQSPTGAAHRVRFLKRDYKPDGLANREISADYVEVG